MPPFCAPSPGYLLTDPAPSPEEEEPEHQEDGGRAQVIALLVDALNDAEVAAANGQNDNTADSANQAYTSLCYDFPIVSTSALVALNTSFKSSHLEAGKPLFPLTRKFTAGLGYLVSVEYRKRAAADGRPQEDGGISESESVDVTDFETRTHHLLALCASVFLLVPALRLAISHKDEGASLSDFLASYDAGTDVRDRQSASVLDDGPDIDSHSGVEEVHCEIGDSSEATEVDDDDSDWEPLDSEPSIVNAATVEEFASSDEGASRGWDSLMEKVAHLTSLVPKEVINTCVWEELQLTKHLIHALSGLRMLEKKEAGVDAITAAELYTGLLADRLLFGCSSSSVSSDLSAVISALLNLVEASKDSKHKIVAKASTSTSHREKWDLLFLTTLAKLCTKVGGFPIGSSSSYDAASAERKSTKEGANVVSSVFVRCLWQSTSSTLLFLQEQLDNSARSADSFLQVELVLSILCFLVKYAPGNADLGSMLVGGGFFRTALSFFIKVGAEQRMEVLRQFLHLSIGTSSAAADYAAQMPNFRAALLSPEFVKNSFTRPYAVIWPLLLQTSSTASIQSSSKYTTSKAETENEAGHALVGALNGIARVANDDVSVYKQYWFLKELVELHWMLQLLAEAVTCSSSSSFKLWKRGGLVDRAISQCQVTLGGVLVQETQRRALAASSVQENDAKKSETPKDSKNGELEETGLHSNSPIDDASKVKRSAEQEGKSEAEIVVSKTMEILPRVLLLLKQLSSLTNGARGAKID